MKKLFFFLISFLFASLAHAAVITPEFGGGTGTSTVFRLNSIILQGPRSQYTSVPTGTLGSVLSMLNNIPTWVATSTLGISAGSSGLTSISALTGPAIQIATTSDTNIVISVNTTTANTLTIVPGFTGTLAAGRLNGNVVQGITNDTNVTGTISAQVLTIGWTGTLADSRLNANVLTSVATTSAGNIFFVSTSTNRITLNFPANIVSNVATGTAGGDFNVSTSTTGSTNSLVINCPSASGTVRGCLSSTDWTTFNGKQAAGAYLTSVSADSPLGGSGTSGSHLTCTGCLTAVTLNGLSGSAHIIATSTGGDNYYISTSSQTVTINLPLNIVNRVATGTAGGDFSVSTSTDGSSNFLTINCPSATATVRGCLTGTDWTTFNGKISAVTLNGLSAASFIIATSTGGNNYYISTSSQTVTLNLPANLVNNISTGTAGTDFFISTSTLGSGNSLTINIPTAANGVRGLLNSTDWNTFNNKQAALSNPVTGTAASPQVTYFTAATAVAGSNNFEWLNGGQILSVNSTTPYASLVVEASSSATTIPIFVVASSTNVQILTVTNTSRVSINSSSPNATLVVQSLASNAATPDILEVSTSTGAILFSIANNGAITNTAATATSSFATTTIAGINIIGRIDKSFQIASTTTDTFLAQFSSATTTWNLWNPSYPVVLTKLYCKTDTGTVNLQISTNTMVCTSTGASSTASSVFNPESDVDAKIGTSASSPNRVRVTLTFKPQ